MKTSARNELGGIISSITPGPVLADVCLDIGNDLSIVASITSESIQRLQLTPGQRAIAVIKASMVLLTPNLGLRTSARNRLPARVIASLPDTVNSAVKLELAGGQRLTAIITNESLREQGYQPGSACCALIKSSHVILALDESCD